MALKEIIILPDKQLRLVSKPVEKVTAEIRKLADDMLETMYDAPGIGLAAIQVAQPVRLITMDLAKREEGGETTQKPRVFLNPEIISSSRGRVGGMQGRLPGKAAKNATIHAPRQPARSAIMSGPRGARGDLPNRHEDEGMATKRPAKRAAAANVPKPATRARAERPRPGLVRCTSV